MRVTEAILAVLLLLLSAGMSSAQTYQTSYDCTKARKCMEQTVCQNKELAELDRALAESYRKAMSIFPAEERKKLKQAQRLWLKKRDNCSGYKLIIECAVREYNERIKELAIHELSGSRFVTSGDNLVAVNNESTLIIPMRKYSSIIHKDDPDIYIPFTLTIMDIQEKNSFYYVLMNLFTFSKPWGDGGGRCGAGTESSLIYAAISPFFKTDDIQYITLHSCWNGVDTRDEQVGKDGVYYEVASKGIIKIVEYDYHEPEKGLSIRDK